MKNVLMRLTAEGCLFSGCPSVWACVLD